MMEKESGPKVLQNHKRLKQELTEGSGALEAAGSSVLHSQLYFFVFV